jgi:hypothetical protein
MTDDELMRDLMNLNSSLDVLTPDGSKYIKWFLSFGSLLYAIRDKKNNIPFTQDIDISIVGTSDYERIKTSLQGNGFQINNYIKNDLTDEVLFADFKSKHGLNIDLFFWIEHNGFMWHTYDYMAEHPSDGIPGQYHFKGTPAWMMKGEPFKYRWFDNISPLKVPHLYGTLLDYWYPHWFIPDSEFGQSRAQITVEPKTCKNLETTLCLNY